jgi:PA domain
MLALSIALGTCGQGVAIDTAIAAIRPEAIRADMRLLADDLLEGRGTGARGHLVAARYVASRFEGMGLAPAGGGNLYEQDVSIRSARVDETASGATLSHAGREAKLTFREDHTLGVDPGRPDVDIEAPIVFVGFGVTAPSQGYDDYGHIDVKGKIVAVLFGAPNFPSAVKAHYSAGWLKRQNAAAHGAVGFLTFADPVLEKIYPFKERVGDLDIPGRNWLDSQGRPNLYYPQLKVVGFVSMAGVQRFLAESGHSSEQIYAAAKVGRPPSFPLAQMGRFHTVTHSSSSPPGIRNCCNARSFCGRRGAGASSG